MKLDTWLDKTYKLRAKTAVGPKVMWGDGKNHGINEIYFNRWLGTPKYDNGVDIVSFYWDSTEQQCYGVASLAFATP